MAAAISNPLKSIPFTERYARELRFELGALFNEINLVDILSQFHMGNAEHCLSLLERAEEIVKSYQFDHDIDETNAKLKAILEKMAISWCNTLAPGSTLNTPSDDQHLVIPVNDEQHEHYLQVCKDFLLLCKKTENIPLSCNPDYPFLRWKIPDDPSDDYPKDRRIRFCARLLSPSVENGPTKQILFLVGTPNIPSKPWVDRCKGKGMGNKEISVKHNERLRMHINRNIRYNSRRH